MNKVIITIIIIIIPVFALEFILGGKGKSAQKDNFSDSTVLEKDTSIYVDSAEILKYDGIRGQTIIGQRSRANIMRGIDQNSNTIRKEYINYMRQGNKLNGGLIVRFKIISTGEIVDCKILQSDINDMIFEKNIVLTIKRWKFSEIQIENDTTIVEYPFVFEQY
ncbi:MAG: AgmX/PglI C-terminal domain-containing protein [Chitinispirillales bacterium]|jgi:TonB family protein|nr:AgmX/PglI C-terminal domain-containing protein [Chitinispirillales bacterium]